MKKEYISPEIEVFLFECDDVICSSTNGDGWYTPDTELPEDQEGVGQDSL